MAAARNAGVPVADYLDNRFAKPGATAETVRAMLKLADIHGDSAAICEIGPGSGRYAEAVINTLHPVTYEIYETATDWLAHLAKLPNAVIRPCDGRTLSPTSDGSVDLVHAQKVFVYLEFSATVGYLDEMARVVRPGGAVAFDIVSEACLQDDIVRGWAKRGTIYRPIPRTWAIEFLQRRGLTLLGSHLAPLTDGTTELMVFRRE
jgi:phospholipid N-methyltransferase